MKVSAGQPVAQQGQLDLGFALLAVGVLPEDVEDDGGAVDGRASQQLLQIELLGGGELVVEHDGVHVQLLGQLADLGDLPAAEVGGRIGRHPALHDAFRAALEQWPREGIPANPNDMVLHKELAWIFLHKIGGYTDDAIVQHGVLEDGTEFLQKPFTRDALTVRVREVLDS